MRSQIRSLTDTGNKSESEVKITLGPIISVWFKSESIVRRLDDYRHKSGWRPVAIFHWWIKILSVYTDLALFMSQSCNNGAYCSALKLNQQIKEVWSMRGLQPAQDLYLCVDWLREQEKAGVGMTMNINDDRKQETEWKGLEVGRRKGVTERREKLKRHCGSSKSATQIPQLNSTQGRNDLPLISTQTVETKSSRYGLDSVSYTHKITEKTKINK